MAVSGTPSVQNKKAGSFDWSRMVPRAPSPRAMWTNVLIVASVAVGLFLLDRLSSVMLNYWLLESMGYGSVFWTNFEMQAWLFAVTTALLAIAITLPAILHGFSRSGQLRALWFGALLGALLGYATSVEYLEFLGATGSIQFNEKDPIFGNDISFYVFDLPPLMISLITLLIITVTGLIASIWTAVIASRDSRRPDEMTRLVHFMGRIATPYTLVMFVASGSLIAILLWLRRYGLLTMPNFEQSTEKSGAGAEYVDIVGFFSTKNSLYVEALAVILLTIGMTLMLRTASNALANPKSVNIARAFRPAAFALVLLPGITADLAFRSAVALRDQLLVRPNEPVIQLPYLQRHIDATVKAFGLDKIEEKTFRPKTVSAPLPKLEELLRSPTIQNAPLWTGSVARYSRRVAPQYIPRILAAEGDMTVYAPTLQILEAQQTLRPYYGFMDVDTIVSRINGKMTLLASGVREQPQDIMRPWLVAWGQRSLVFTHGHGLVTMPMSERTTSGDPNYTTWGVPIKARTKLLEVKDPSIYYGEGAVNAAFSNAQGLKEHDVATEQGRKEVEYVKGENGIFVNSLLKRIVVGYQSGHFLNVFFSDLITSKTRVHIWRRPLERVEQVAPFLRVDTDPYAFPTKDRVKWMVNALTYSDKYPYSGLVQLGSPADLRTEWRPLERVNYVADAVKATVDADTGQVTLYQFADEPIINTWKAIYPDLFKARKEMPAEVREQVQYPRALMSVQFNMVYPFYHQRDALTFYSGEDLLDDADEVIGKIIAGSGTQITFSQDLYNWIAVAGDVLPDAEDKIQFALTKTFTPQDPLNLRAIATVYQTGVDYGRISVLKIPKGEFFMGPEQADAAIDQDPYVAQEIGLWNRLGVQVIRGRTSLLMAKGEAIYVEPLFIRSRQNPVPQLQRVIVVLRGKVHMGRTMDEALKFAIEGGRLTTFSDKGSSQAKSVSTSAKQ